MRSVIVVGVLLFGACSAPPSDGDKVKAARRLVSKLAQQAFTQWTIEHPDKACPTSIDDLGALINEDRAVDPWGGKMHMACGDQLPPGAKGIAIWSLGPDGVESTDDDIRSMPAK